MNHNITRIYNPRRIRKLNPFIISIKKNLRQNNLRHARPQNHFSASLLIFFIIPKHSRIPKKSWQDILRLLNPNTTYHQNISTHYFLKRRFYRFKSADLNCGSADLIQKCPTMPNRHIEICSVADVECKSRLQDHRLVHQHRHIVSHHHTFSSLDSQTIQPHTTCFRSGQFDISTVSFESCITDFDPLVRPSKVNFRNHKIRSHNDNRMTENRHKNSSSHHFLPYFFHECLPQKIKYCTHSTIYFSKIKKMDKKRQNFLYPL